MLQDNLFSLSDVDDAEDCPSVYTLKMMFFRRHAQRAVPPPPAPPPTSISSTIPLTIETDQIVEDERESAENDPSSTPTALSPVEKTVNLPSEIDCPPSTSTNEHLSLKHPGLLRLFDSTVCTASIVISYLFSSKEPLVQQFLGKKLFDYSPDELDFYLPQLINMYIHIPSISTVIHDYVTSRSIEQRTDDLPFSAVLLDVRKVWTSLCNARGSWMPT